MQAAPLRFLTAAAWPLTIWTTLKKFEDHAADDYVERTSPIVATAIGFWVCLAALVVVTNPVATSFSVGFLDSDTVASVRRTPTAFVSVLWFFTPVIYLVGLWLFTAREEAFPR